MLLLHQSVSIRLASTWCVALQMPQLQSFERTFHSGPLSEKWSSKPHRHILLPALAVVEEDGMLATVGEASLVEYVPLKRGIHDSQLCCQTSVCRLRPCSWWTALLEENTAIAPNQTLTRLLPMLIIRSGVLALISEDSTPAPRRKE